MVVVPLILRMSYRLTPSSQLECIYKYGRVPLSMFIPNK